MLYNEFYLPALTHHLFELDLAYVQKTERRL